MTGSITVSGQTSSGFTLTWAAATDAVGVTAYEVDNGSGTYTSIGTALTLAVTGKTAATGYTVRVRAKDAAGNYATPLSATAMTTAAADATAPAMVGDITVSAITTSGATLSCAAATDAVGVTGYEYSIDGGTSYSVIANAARSVVVSGRPAGTAHSVRMRAFDAAGNRATPLSASFTTLATQPAQNAVVAATVAESRRVPFPGGTRVVKFGTVPSARLPNAPYLEAGKWWSEKHPLDERYWVADITVDLAERGTTATSVAAIVAGVTVIEQPVIQGKLIPVKLGGFNAAIGAANFCTLRISLANGERIDRTTWFKQQEGVYSLSKDPDEQSYYVGDIGNDLADSNTTATQVKALPVGVEELVPAVIQGPLILVKLGGMDTLPSGVNYCDLRIDCANSERFYRTIQFNRVDN
jgi:chitodextrinase